jgi:hypothetical protein
MTTELPPEDQGTEQIDIPDPALAPDIEEEYEPKFDRLSTTRRVLGHVTDEDHVGMGPRNTPERLAYELAGDPYTNFDQGDDVQEHLDDLEAAGLVQKREDGTYAVTEAGTYELMH